MSYVRVFCFTVGIILICVTFAYSQEREVEKYPLPPKPREEDVVGVDMAQKIASVFAEEQFGPGAMSEPMIGYSPNGSIMAYIFILAIKKDKFPTEAEIRRELSEARQLLPKAKAELAKIRETSLRSGKAELERRGNVPFLKKNTEWEEAEERVRDIENECCGVRRYGTVITSARKDLAPVLTCSNTLPYYYIYREVAEKMAKAELGANISLLRYLYVGSLDQGFVFETSVGDRISILMFPFRAAEPGEITTVKLEVTAEERTWIRQKWDEAMKEVQREDEK